MIVLFPQPTPEQVKTAQTEGTLAAFLMYKEGLSASDAVKDTKGRTACEEATGASAQAVWDLVHVEHPGVPTGRVESLRIDSRHMCYMAYSDNACYLVDDCVIGIIQA